MQPGPGVPARQWLPFPVSRTVSCHENSQMDVFNYLAVAMSIVVGLGLTCLLDEPGVPAARDLWRLKFAQMSVGLVESGER